MEIQVETTDGKISRVTVEAWSAEECQTLLNQFMPKPLNAPTPYLSVRSLIAACRTGDKESAVKATQELLGDKHNALEVVQSAGNWYAIFNSFNNDGVTPEEMWRREVDSAPRTSPRGIEYLIGRMPLVYALCEYARTILCDNDRNSSAASVKIATIKFCRTLTSCGLKDAKDFVEANVFDSVTGAIRYVA